MRLHLWRTLIHLNMLADGLKLQEIQTFHLSQVTVVLQTMFSDQMVSLPSQTPSTYGLRPSSTQLLDTLPSTNGTTGIYMYTSLPSSQESIM